MYFRSPDPSGSRREEIRLPEHYGGCAFPRPDAVQEPNIPTEPPKEEVNRHTPPTKDGHTGENQPSSPTLGKFPSSAPQEEPTLPQESPRAKGRGLLPLGFGGLALDELLLLGLLLLLGREGEDSEILLLLLLLLLCGG